MGKGGDDTQGNIILTTGDLALILEIECLGLLVFPGEVTDPLLNAGT
jgi:hypothetical protein